MSNLTKKQRKDFVEQTLASEAIEGYRPAPSFLLLLEMYISGELTLTQIDAITNQKFSSDGKAKPT